MNNTGRRIMASILAVLMAFNIIMCNVQYVDAALSSNEDTLYLNEVADANSKKIVSVSLGFASSAAISQNGELYTWGDNSDGQLGDGTKEDKITPVKIMDNVAMVCLDEDYSGAVTKSGELYMWGYNYCGKLGDETTETWRTSPVKVMDDVTMVSLGWSHSGAVKKSGELYMWGYNQYGQLGDGTTQDKRTSVKIMDNVATVSLGDNHSAAVTKSGELYMWGYNKYGQLGDGTTEDKSKPVKIMDNVAMVSLGGNYSAAVTKSGELYMWGNNSGGVLGIGMMGSYKSTPVKIMDNVAAVSLGWGHSAAVTKSGELYTWGSNNAGELGDGTTTSSSTPKKVMENIAMVSLGSSYSGVVTTSGELYTWGANSYGQLGDGTTSSSKVPVKPVFPLDRIDYIRAFVERLYTNILGRAGDDEGISSWVTLLANGTYNGATASYGFVNSNEFLNSGFTNEQKVEIFYSTFLNRVADADGKKIWVDALDAGVDLEKIFEGFVMSTEFAGICETYGISQGQMSDIAGMTDILNRYRNRNISLTEFAARCYTKALGRVGDIAGIDSWCMQILTGA
ncbi:MAG: DUF4214 domain-containing protein, partial [Lachnospiraceae bacterium]